MCSSAGRTCTAIVAAIACIAATATGPSPLVPGDHIGRMSLARVGYTDKLVSIFNFCDPRTYAPALYHRHCTVPRVRRLFIGYGDFEATYPALNQAWRT